MEKQEVILEIRSVQRDEFHRQGDIRVDGPDTLRKGQPWGLARVVSTFRPLGLQTAGHRVHLAHCFLTLLLNPSAVGSPVGRDFG
jgi:hypothetical protein